MTAAGTTPSPTAASYHSSPQLAPSKNARSGGRSSGLPAARVVHQIRAAGERCAVRSTVLADAALDAVELLAPLLDSALGAVEQLRQPRPDRFARPVEVDGH